jgi:hypothetical protein
LIADVIQGTNGVLEGDLPGLKGANAVQGGVADRKGLPEAETDLVGSRLKLRQGDDGVKSGCALPELAHTVGLISRLSHNAGSCANHAQHEQVSPFPIHAP